MNKTPNLEDFEDNWQTSMGGWLFEDDFRVMLRGKEVFKDCNDWSWMKYILYGITGRELKDNELKLFEAMWVITGSYPEPRLWPNRIASFAGTTRSTALLGVVGGSALTEAKVYGHRAGIKAISYLTRIKQKLERGKTLSNIIKEEGLKNCFGFGRPIYAKVDERIKPMMAAAKKYGLDQGDYIQLAFQVEKELGNVYKNRVPLNMNIAAVITALAADMGLTARQFYIFTTVFFSGGMYPCYLDALNHKEGTFLPLRCNRIAYSGKPIRQYQTIDER